jgi:hypothetical protein
MVVRWVRIPTRDLGAAVLPGLGVTLLAVGFELVMMALTDTLALAPIAAFLVRLVVVGAVTVTLMVFADPSIRDQLLRRIRPARTAAAGVQEE